MAAASLKTQKVVEDVGSDELTVLREQFNALLSVLANLGDDDDGSDIKTALEAAGVKYVTVTKNLPDPRRFPAV